MDCKYEILIVGNILMSFEALLSFLQIEIVYSDSKSFQWKLSSYLQELEGSDLV